MNGQFIGKQSILVLLLMPKDKIKACILRLWMLKSCGFPEAFVCRGLDHWCRSDIFIIPFKTDLQAKLSNSVMKGLIPVVTASLLSCILAPHFNFV